MKKTNNISIVIQPPLFLLLFVILLSTNSLIAQSTKILPLKVGKTYLLMYKGQGYEKVTLVSPVDANGWIVVNMDKDSWRESNSNLGIALNLNRVDFIQESAVSRDPIEIKNHQDAILSDLANLAADSYQYKIRPTSMGGGNGTYSGYSIESTGSWGESNPNARYEIVTATASKVKLKAISKLFPTATIDVTYDGNGRVINGPNSEGF